MEEAEAEFKKEPETVKFDEDSLRQLKKACDPFEVLDIMEKIESNKNKKFESKEALEANKFNPIV